jgi:hypothetical protein
MTIWKIFFQSTMIVLFLVLGSFIFDDPSFAIFCSLLSWPIWVLAFCLRGMRSDFDFVQFQNYINTAQIKRNTDRIK